MIKKKNLIIILQYNLYTNASFHIKDGSHRDIKMPDSMI